MISTITDPLFAAASSGPLDFLHTMKGPDFLGLFFVWFLVTFLTVVTLRAAGYDDYRVTAAGLACFEALGVARIVVGSFHGMGKWGFLIAMMGIGALCFFIRAKHFEGTGGGSGDGGGGDTGGTWWSSDSGGSGSSGGGGCGGGGSGCGGCGGGGD
jgi:hypothetical protein